MNTELNGCPSSKCHENNQLAHGELKTEIKLLDSKKATKFSARISYLGVFATLALIFWAGWSAQSDNKADNKVQAEQITTLKQADTEIKVQFKELLTKIDERDQASDEKFDQILSAIKSLQPPEKRGKE